MFIGHFGVGFAGKRAAPAVSLGTLFLAAQFADGLWPLLLLLGVEHVRIAPGTMKLSPFDFYDYPWSHSLVAIVVWGVLLGGAYYVLRRSLRGAAVVAAGVVSHWFLDFLVHRPDMPVFPRGPYLGLGLWNSLPATVLLEVGVLRRRARGLRHGDAGEGQDGSLGALVARSSCSSRSGSRPFSRRLRRASSPSPCPASRCGSRSPGATGSTATGSSANGGSQGSGRLAAEPVNAVEEPVGIDRFPDEVRDAGRIADELHP